MEGSSRHDDHDHDEKKDTGRQGKQERARKREKESGRVGEREGEGAY